MKLWKSYLIVMALGALAGMGNVNFKWWVGGLIGIVFGAIFFTPLVLIDRSGNRKKQKAKA